MQKVACPMMIVRSERLTPPKMNSEFSAIPVMMPGRERGRTRRSDTASRPKNRNRWTPNAAADPSSRATIVAATAALSDNTSAALTWESCHATENQRRVSPAMGQLCTLDLLKAYRMMVAIGAKRNKRTATTQIVRPILVARPSISASQRFEGAQGASTDQVRGHDDDGDEGQCRREGKIAGDADVVVDHVADEIGAGSTDQDRRDVVAEGQGESEDRSRHHTGQGQREHHPPDGQPIA